MSLFILDDHLVRSEVRERVLRRATARYVRDVRPGEIVKDDRILMVLQTLRTPTFVTVDDWFWNRDHRDRRYCIVFVVLRGRSDSHVPDLLRRLLRLTEFRTRAARMGKVVHLGDDHVRWWQLGDDSEYAVHWGRPSSRRTGRRSASLRGRMIHVLHRPGPCDRSHRPGRSTWSRRTSRHQAGVSEGVRLNTVQATDRAERATVPIQPRTV